VLVTIADNGAGSARGPASSPAASWRR